MTFKRKYISNLLFFGFIIFLFTPYGLNTKAKITEGLLYIKGILMTPAVKSTEERIALDNFNVNLKEVSNARDINLNSLKGKVVFINHWATWCGPCRAEMPSLNKLYRDYADKVSFIFLTNDPKKAVDKYYEAYNFDFPTYMPISALPQQINTTTLPATFILDKEGRIILEEFSPADWNTTSVRELLDKLIE